MIELSELEKQDITIVPLQVQQHERAFKEKDIDAVITFDPARKKIIEMGGNVLFESSQISGEIVDVLVVRTEKIRLFEKNIKDLKWSWFKMIKNIQAEPHKYAKYIDMRMSMGEENLMSVFDGLNFPDKEKNAFLLNGLTEKSLPYSAKKVAKNNV